MEPCDTFTGIIHVTPVERKGRGYQKLFDFAWNYFKRPVTMEKSPETLVHLQTAFTRQLYWEKKNGLIGLNTLLKWDEDMNIYTRNDLFQAGWVGQNISLACMLLRGYIMTGEVFLRDRALAALDSWVKHGVLPNGMIYARLVADPPTLNPS